MTTSSLLCDKLKATSLFQVYQGAFESVTGSSLDLTRERGLETSIPVPVGKMKPCFLSTNAGDPSVVGILESFAMQLGDEANRAFLVCCGAQPQVVKGASRYILEHLSERIQLEKVADEVGVCSFQLCRLFKKQMGITMTEYVNRQRVEKAKRCLEDRSSRILSVVSDAGFTSLSQFNRNFLKYAGESPSEYRGHLGELEHCQLGVT